MNAFRALVIAVLAFLDDSTCRCEACLDLRGYACRWVRDHGDREYRKDGGHVIEWRRPRQREAI